MAWVFSGLVLRNSDIGSPVEKRVYFWIFQTAFVAGSIILDKSEKGDKGGNAQNML